MAAKKKRTSVSGEETRSKIVAATLRTLRDQGIVGTSARAIAKEGDFNQALIFYHFGSIDELVLSAVGDLSKQRLERHHERLEDAEHLRDFIRIARELNTEDRANDNMKVLTQAFAGGVSDPKYGAKLYDLLEPWSDMVADALKRVLADSPAASLVPDQTIAMLMSSLFLGIELLDGLGTKKYKADELFDELERLAGMLDLLVSSPILQSLQGPAKK